VLLFKYFRFATIEIGRIHVATRCYQISNINFEFSHGLGQEWTFN